MKKKEIILIFLLFSISFLITGVTGESITGEVITGDIITGDVSAQDMDIYVFILPGPPTLEIFHPENKTYFINESLLLNFSQTYAQSIWYNLEGGNNITITSSTYINLSFGGHELFLYANNSQGEESFESVNFTTVEGLFTIIYSDYQGNSHGASTDFRQIAFEDIQNLSDILIENTAYGKILFLESINVTNDLNSTDNIVDLDENTNISLNRIELNATALPNFNKSATIWIYNLNLNDPRILKDGEVCPSSVCTLESYTGNTFKFNVTEFSVYSAEETPVTVVVGGGGGRGSEAPQLEFDIENIVVKLKEGETKRKTITVTNIGRNTEEISISISGLEDYTKISKTEIKLARGESETIEIDFMALENTPPELYLGQLIFETAGGRETIPVALEIISKTALLDVLVEIPEKFLYLLPGDELIAEIELYNLGETKRTDVTLKYEIRDLDGNIIAMAEETLAIDTKIAFLKTMIIPKDTKSGDYTFYVRAIYEGQTASASAWFKVEKRPLISSYYIFKTFLAIIIALIALIIWIIFKKRKKEKKKKKSK